MPATLHDVAEYQHCLEFQDVWVLGLEWSAEVKEFFEPEDHITAYKIIGCESSGMPLAKNPSSSAGGLWQFIDKTWLWVESRLKFSGSRFNPWDSTYFASYLKYKTPQGWEHWSQSAACWKGFYEKNKFTKVN